MAIGEQRRRLINELAQDVIDLFHIDIPIENIDEVVRNMGGIIKEDYKLSEYSDGIIRKTSVTSFEIRVSPDQSSGRRNFTIAHELGHLFLHMGFLINDEIWNNQQMTFYRKGNSQEEYEANEFAAAFLMPQRQYKRVLDQYAEGNLVDTSKIAQEFNVSTKAASNRGKWLGYLVW